MRACNIFCWQALLASDLWKLIMLIHKLIDTCRNTSTVYWNISLFQYQYITYTITCLIFWKITIMCICIPWLLSICTQHLCYLLAPFFSLTQHAQLKVKWAYVMACCLSVCPYLLHFLWKYEVPCLFRWNFVSSQNSNPIGGHIANFSFSHYSWHFCMYQFEIWHQQVYNR